MYTVEKENAQSVISYTNEAMLYFCNDNSYNIILKHLSIPCFVSTGTSSAWDPDYYNTLMTVFFPVSKLWFYVVVCYRIHIIYKPIQRIMRYSH